MFLVFISILIFFTVYYTYYGNDDDGWDQRHALEVCFFFFSFFSNPQLPHEYIKIIPHPHSPDPTTIIIALSSLNSPAARHLEHTTYMPHPEPCPWAPFENIADFEYTETAILGLLPRWIINKQLAGLNSSWADRSRLTIKNFTEMDKVLSKARKYFVQVSKKQQFNP